MEAAHGSFRSFPQRVQWLFAGIGALLITTRALSFVQLLANAFILRGADLRKYGENGTWAVITGASDGLGKLFASELAAKSFNLVLVSRTQSKLEAVAQELQVKHPDLQIKILAMDYSQNDNADYDRLRQLVDGLEIGILINNVGQSHSFAVPFILTEEAIIDNIVTVNCLGTLRTTRVIAPGMAQRKRGLILNMGSTAGWMPMPYLATYAGSKSFLHHWSAALASELKESNVDVYLVFTHYTVGTMSKIWKPSTFAPMQPAYVRAALAKVGLGGTQNLAHMYAPWWSHALMQWCVEHIIGEGSKLGLWYNLGQQKNIRIRALRKWEREAEKAAESRKAG
ncbi:putative 3-ketoacyl- reductase protein [Phaeoacremonium minimum UCRPA7]|uniref:Very-long-chain 3-oxoacyl-CoA reductase n=1 Tax=Phaeoacremonium minimum (strain UCR-PA7) TaxID=1286976 RepID=R8BEW3_PHAM7|nr:putative 3-ketoacyl- reductase protein [Phaeoacremonium minimum UCRPA7]EON97839.1 putative 3-ketoacyl- reductase protein [Phaeoacremonium minimum UCRPA7]